MAVATSEQPAVPELAPAPDPGVTGPSAPVSPSVQVAECTGGMVRDGYACRCPVGTKWEGNRCLTPCHYTQRRENGQCVCPKDTRWNGERCELWQECKPGQVRIGAACLCPSGTTWDASAQACVQTR